MIKYKYKQSIYTLITEKSQWYIRWFIFTGNCLPPRMRMVCCTLTLHGLRIFQSYKIFDDFCRKYIYSLWFFTTFRNFDNINYNITFGHGDFSYFIFRGFDLQCIHRGTSGYTSIPIPNFQHFYCLLWVIIKICSLS